MSCQSPAACAWPQMALLFDDALRKPNGPSETIISISKVVSFLEIDLRVPPI